MWQVKCWVWPGFQSVNFECSPSPFGSAPDYPDVSERDEIQSGLISDTPPSRYSMCCKLNTHQCSLLISQHFHQTGQCVLEESETIIAVQSQTHSTKASACILLVVQALAGRTTLLCFLSHSDAPSGSLPKQGNTAAMRALQRLVLGLEVCRQYLPASSANLLRQGSLCRGSQSGPFNTLVSFVCHIHTQPADTACNPCHPSILRVAVPSPL